MVEEEDGGDEDVQLDHEYVDLDKHDVDVNEKDKKR